ncbi:hypothetical protein CHELA17_20455 [Chelatococcus asaccharovorans]|nr:hypothetical protein CHELA17_20455 [Chelatococcus asaccharovorans]
MSAADVPGSAARPIAPVNTMARDFESEIMGFLQSLMLFYVFDAAAVVQSGLKSVLAIWRTPPLSWIGSSRVFM